MKKPTPSTRDSDAQDSLLGDLESIRTLLDRTAEPASTPDDSDGVPMLEDMIEGAFTVNESVLTSRASFDDGVAVGSGKSGLADDTIKALLGDQWRAQARKILSDARSTAFPSGAVPGSNDGRIKPFCKWRIAVSDTVASTTSSTGSSSSRRKK